ncbi:TPA: hypothetical protein DCG86_07800, partial [Candidatus Marinimicrobia bacterium]|nr:hypothetical protein [Candidatus Neomarinimicrobiota bacterium]
QYALSFGIGDNFTLKKFNTSIAVKKIRDEKHQIRLFVSPGLYASHATHEDDGQLMSDNKSQNYSLNIGTDYLWIVLKNRPVNLFTGTGLAVGYDYSVSKNIFYASDDESIYKTYGTAIEAGLRGILGVEWRVNPHIGIHSEYLVTGTYRWRKIENTTLDKINKEQVANLSSNVIFGLSVYLKSDGRNP